VLACQCASCFVQESATENVRGPRRALVHLSQLQLSLPQPPDGGLVLVAPPPADDETESLDQPIAFAIASLDSAKGQTTQPRICGCPYSPQEAGGGQDNRRPKGTSWMAPERSRKTQDQLKQGGRCQLNCGY
jgi:hypothetical protein